MQECAPITTFRQFLDGPLEYVFPAPGGALADGAVRSSADCDLYLAALASKAKRGIVPAEPAEYLGRHLEIVKTSRLFDEATDAKIIERVGSWIREIVN